MSVPPFENYLLPMLKQYKNGDQMHIKDVRNLVAKELNLSQEDLDEMTQGGNEYKHNDRVYWSRTYLSKAGLLEGARGFYTITEEGKKLLNENPSSLSRNDLERYKSFREFKNKKSTMPNAEPLSTTEIEDADPKEILLTSLNEINEALATDLLDAVKEQSDDFFERLVVKLLEAMGYGGKLSNPGEVVGGTGDGGIDGIINQDPLGLDKIYLQAKKYTENPVTAADLRDFVGAVRW